MVQDIHHAWNGKMSQRRLGHWTDVIKEFQSTVHWILQHQHCPWLWADWQLDSFSSPEAEGLENEGLDKREGDKPIYKWGVCCWQCSKQEGREVALEAGMGSGPQPLPLVSSSMSENPDHRYDPLTWPEFFHLLSKRVLPTFPRSLFRILHFTLVSEISCPAWNTQMTFRPWGVP